MSISPSILYAPCPCGSGKKFNFCHLDEVRDSLRDDPTQSDVTTAVRKAMQPFGMVNDVDPIEDRESIRIMFAAMKDRDAGRTADALAGFRKAREMTPKLMTAWNNEALCLWYMERFDEALALQEEGLARSALLDNAVWEGDFTRAKELVEGYRLPARVHPLEMRNWYQALLRYAEATGNTRDAKFARKNLDMLEKAFPDL